MRESGEKIKWRIFLWNLRSSEVKNDCLISGFFSFSLDRAGGSSRKKKQWTINGMIAYKIDYFSPNSSSFKYCVRAVDQFFLFESFLVALCSFSSCIGGAAQFITRRSTKSLTWTVGIGEFLQPRSFWILSPFGSPSFILASTSFHIALLFPGFIFRKKMEPVSKRREPPRNCCIIGTGSKPCNNTGA